MDKLDKYNQSIEHIFSLIKVLDMATNKGLTNPKDNITYTEYRGNEKIRMYGTREEIELFLDFRIDIIIRLNTKFRKDFLREDRRLSQNEKDKMLRIKKNN